MILLIISHIKLSFCKQPVILYTAKTEIQTFTPIKLKKKSK